MDRFSVQLSKRLGTTLEGMIYDATHKLVHTRASDYADYRERIGVITGLARALKLLEETESSLGREETAEPLPVTNRRYEE